MRSGSPRLPTTRLPMRSTRWCFVAWMGAPSSLRATRHAPDALLVSGLALFKEVM